MLSLAKLRMINEVLPTLPVICKGSGVNYNTLIKRMNRMKPELTTVESVKLKAEIDRAIRNINEVLNGQ
jgi:hypothetical protein